MKHLLKYNLIVKPACLFDSSIKVEIQVLFSDNGQYNNGKSRQITADLTQI